MKRLSKKAVIPTETLLGISSDESRTESEPLEFGEEQHDGQSPKHAGHFRMSFQHETAKPKNDITDDSNERYEAGNESDELSPSESVRKRLRKRRSARASNMVPQEEVRPKSQPSTTSHNEDHTKSALRASISHQAPSVEDVPDNEANLRSEDDEPADSCSPRASTRPTSVKAAPATPIQTTAQVTTSDDCLDPDPSLDSETCSHSRRARFSERVEIRTSPTFWQREHPEGDNPYAQFQYEQYQDDLRDGNKAIPLKDPLRDPDGRTAGRLYVPLCSIDDHSFNSWGNEGAAGWEDFAARFRPNSTEVSSDNQPCPFSPIAPSGWNSQHDYFDGYHNPENHHAKDWTSRRDARRTERNHGPSAEQAGSFWYTHDQYPNMDYDADGAGNYFDSSSGYPDDYGSFGGFGFNSYRSNDRGLYKEEDGFFNSNCNSASAHQQHYQGSQSSSPKEKRHGFNFGNSDTHENLNTRSSYNFSGHMTEQDTTTGHGASRDAGIPFESSTTSSDVLQEPKLPPIGIVMEIPDDMSDSDVHTLLIPGCDDYIPMAY
ncbi:hypothetical protein SGCOL_003125 [Colletotrichum sp. CLE4]